MSKRIYLLIGALSTTFALCVIAGCGASGVKTHPVAGKIAIQGAEVKPLAGHTVEIALDTNPELRASGQIRDDGSFELETLHSGTILKGAVAGTYKARIVLSDDDAMERLLAAKSIPARYLQFEKSGLSLQVPATDGVTLNVLRR